MLRVTLPMLLLLWRQDLVFGVRIVELRVPTHEREGGVALLGCQYDMEGDPLYSVKWYKDGDEFFRYSPNSLPSIMLFKCSGVTVDITRSSNTVVALVNLTQESSGKYSCEVSGEAPAFRMSKKDKRIVIQLLPQSGPRLTGGSDKYFLNDLVVMNCSSPPSRPDAHLKWLINDVPVSRERVFGPWYKISPDRGDALEVTLQLKFYAMPTDFVDGVMRIKCQATIAPMYQRETSSNHNLAIPFTAETSVSNTASDTNDGVALSLGYALYLVSFGLLM
ncbi:hypothetical protein K1T71_008848 [Dendrolimus kikuchii]|uniref:Uncharacterized protein n=1 Tax=Dendrolimus kikuchii TaxID=765133 RepID=A0ACC1CW27_9NEOP|nr:hypothetical protein K1T71_008848 [Dendrolimus kikuchii]